MAKQPARYMAVDLFAMRAEGLFASLAAVSCLTVTLNTSGLSANHSQSDICKRPGCACMQKDMLPYKCCSVRKDSPMMLKPIN